MQAKLRLAAAKVKLQQMQPSSAATQSGTSSSHDINARGHSHLNTKQGTHSRAVAHNSNPHRGLYESSPLDWDMSAREHNQNDSANQLTRQRRSRESREDSSKVDSNQMQAAGASLVRENTIGCSRESAGLPGTDSSAMPPQDRLADSNGDAEQDEFCEICMESPLQTVFQPCLHSIACFQCAQKIMKRQNECPMCRTPLQAVLLKPPSSQRDHER